MRIIAQLMIDLNVFSARLPPVEKQFGLEFEYCHRNQCLVKDFELESDGSLDLRKVGQHWGFERASVSIISGLHRHIISGTWNPNFITQIFDHERNNWFEPFDHFRLGPLAVGVLSEPTGHITVVGKTALVVVEILHADCLSFRVHE